MRHILISMRISCNIANPDNYFGFAMATVGSIAYRSGGNTNVTEFFPTSEFSASTDQADINVTQANRIEVIDANRYHIVGSILENGNTIVWDLNYNTLEPDP